MTSPPSLRVLVVDDSALYRQMLKHIVASIAGVEVVGTAADGLEAVSKIAELQPDLVTLDVQMPNLDGLGVLREIKRRSLQTLVVMVSSLTAQGAPETVEALLHGAIDCVLKPAGLEPHLARAEIRQALAERLTAVQATRREVESVVEKTAPNQRAGLDLAMGDCVAVGTSTGGPEALRKVLSAMPAGLTAPLFIVQHMPARFTESLAKRLNDIAAFPVHLAATGMLAEPGHAYLAPGGFHLTAVRREHGVVCRLTQAPPRHGCRPSVDVLLESLVDVYGDRIVATILTGMGSDGLAGCRAVKAVGGAVVAQDRNDCVVYGMPKAVIEAGLADVVLPLDAIGEVLGGNRYRRSKMP